MNEFELKILEADSVEYDGKSISLVIPTSDGYLGILAKHENMVAALSKGEIAFTLPDNERRTIPVSGGIVKVEDNSVLILALLSEDL